MAVMFPSGSYSGTYDRSARMSSSMVSPVSGSTPSGYVKVSPLAAASSASSWMGDNEVGTQVKLGATEVHE